jgi:hypothetical protein
MIIEMELKIAVWVFTISTAIVIIFQACLIAGLPWGAASMGGKYPGKYPIKMRLVALFNVLLLGLFILIIWIDAGYLLNEYQSISSITIWAVVASSAIGTILNTITKSRVERIWAPVALVQLLSSLYIALN